jgi:glycosyltransferase involved in cell wall biosynthesis
MKFNLSIVIPAKNEALSLATLLPELIRLYPDAEIIVVNDGSTDNTKHVCEVNSVIGVDHPYTKGNGAAIKSGIRIAKGNIVVCMDADGQHRPEDIGHLLDKLSCGYDMVVGARDQKGQASKSRSLANFFYNRFAGWMVGHKVDDLTSGFRAVDREKFLEFISLLPNKFSYPTTITMSFFKAGYSVAYLPIDVQRRKAGTESHIRLLRDGARFLLIIFKIGTLSSPLKLFAPISAIIFLTGLCYYFYTFYTEGRFTNMSALLLTSSIMIFLMGLISEQITALYFQRIKNEK